MSTAVHLRVTESGVPGGYPLCAGAKPGDPASAKWEQVSCDRCIAEVGGSAAEESE